MVSTRRKNGKDYLDNSRVARSSLNAGIQGQEWWGRTPIAYRDIDGSTRFQQADWEGTQRVLTNYAGNVLSSYKSTPLGDGYSASGQDDNSLHYGQQEHDAVSGTENAQFRQYDSTVGIWMSPDPYLGSYDFTNPQSLNRYAYALNMPGGAVDPSGLDFCLASGTDYFDDNGTAFVYGLINSSICFSESFGRGDGGGSSAVIVGGGGRGGGGGNDGGGAPSKMMPYPFPATAVLCSTSTGVTFYAPPGFSVSNTAANGATNGLSGAAAAVGQFGYYDYQRYVTEPGSFNFYYGYTPVANIAVGAYLNGAGLSPAVGSLISNTYAAFNSSNGATAQQAQFRNLGFALASGKATYTCQSHP
jgi:RHS repeat-associated protein